MSRICSLQLLWLACSVLLISCDHLTTVLERIGKRITKIRNNSHSLNIINHKCQQPPQDNAWMLTMVPPTYVGNVVGSTKTDPRRLNQLLGLSHQMLGPCERRKSEMGNVHLQRKRCNFWNVFVAVVRHNLYSEGGHYVFSACIALSTFSPCFGE